MKNLFLIDESEKKRILEQHNFFKQVLTEKNNRLKRSNKKVISEGPDDPITTNLQALTGSAQLKYAKDTAKCNVFTTATLRPKKDDPRQGVMYAIADQNLVNLLGGAQSTDMKSGNAVTVPVKVGDEVYFEAIQNLNSPNPVGFWTAFESGPTNPKDPNGPKERKIKKQGMWKCDALIKPLTQDAERLRKDLQTQGYVTYDQLTFPSAANDPKVYEQKPCATALGDPNNTNMCYRFVPGAQVIPNPDAFPVDSQQRKFLEGAIGDKFVFNPSEYDIQKGLYVRKEIPGADKVFGNLIKIIGYYPKSEMSQGDRASALSTTVAGQTASADVCAQYLNAFFDLWKIEGDDPKYTTTTFQQDKMAVQRCTRIHIPTNWKGLTVEKRGLFGGKEKDAKLELNEKYQLLTRQLKTNVEIDGGTYGPSNQPTIDSTWNLNNKKY